MDKREIEDLREKYEADKKEQAIEPVVHLIVFKLGYEEYGILIEQVKEVTITP